MPRISTDNYDTVASWNGSQDLFVVEQPDGTKVATPAMVKQFIEAGDFEATGEVKDGHGNILADMAKSSDVVTALAGKQDALNFDNAPTAGSANPVTSGGIYTALEGLILSNNSTGVISVNETYQIPTAMLSKNIIVLSINRASTCGSIVLPTFQITQGNCASGVKIVTAYGSNPTTEIYAILTISTTGLITLKYLSNWSPVYIVLRAI